MFWKKQRLECILTKGHLMEIIKLNALAGTGKTSRLIEICNENKGKRILFLTFSKMAVEDFKDRISRKGIDAMTIHSLGFKIANTITPGVNLIAGFDPYKHSLIKENDDIKPEDFKYYLGASVNNRFDCLMEYGDRFKAIEQDLYEHYCENNEFSFDFILKHITTNRSMVNYMERYLKYDIVLIDEAQDISPIQQIVLRKVFKNPQIKKIFIAGDILQNIYSFRFSEPDMLIDEIKGEIIETRNKTYRCSRTVSRIANTVLEAYFERNTDLEKFKIPFETHSEKIGSFLYYEDEAEVFDKIIEMMEYRIESNGVIGLLVRNNSDLIYLASCLQNYQRYMMIKDQGNLFVNTRIFYAFSVVIEAFKQFKNYKKASYQLINKLTKCFDGYSGDFADSMIDTYQKIKNGNFNELINSFMYDISSLVDHHEILVFSSFIEELDSIKEYDQKVSLITSLQKNKRNYHSHKQIMLMTIHASKGLGFDDVVLFNMGYKVIDSNNDPLSQELKLFYVGITRTRENLVMYKSNKVTSFIKNMASNYENV